MTALKDWCDNIVFCSTGYETEEELPQVIEKALAGFDPEKDVVVPVGNVTNNLIVGAVLARNCISLVAGADGTPQLQMKFLSMVYKNKEYNVREVVLNQVSVR